MYPSPSTRPFRAGSYFGTIISSSSTKTSGSIPTVGSCPSNITPPPPSSPSAYLTQATSFSSSPSTSTRGSSFAHATLSLV